MLALDLHNNNCCLILDMISFELFSQYLVRKQKEGGGDFSAKPYERCDTVLMHLYRHSNLPAVMSLVKKW